MSTSEMRLIAVGIVLLGVGVVVAVLCLVQAWQGRARRHRMAHHQVRLDEALKQRAGTVLPRMAEILTRGDTDIVADMRLLATGVPSFARRHSDWFGGDARIDVLAEDAETVRQIFAQWLTGRWCSGDEGSESLRYGVRIAWEADVADVIGALGEVDRNLSFGIDLAATTLAATELAEIEIEATDPGEELPVGDALERVSEVLWENRSIIVCELDVNADGRYVFLVDGGQAYDELRLMGAEVGFRFYLPSELSGCGD